VNARPDVLHVSLGTTFGLRVADSQLVLSLRVAGATVEVVAVGLGALDVARKGYPINDWIEAVAARQTIASAARRLTPRTVIVSTTTAALLAPPLDGPYAVRLDATASINRPGLRNAPQRLLERRRLAAARLVIPFSHAAERLLPAGCAPSIVVPPPTRIDGHPRDERDRLAVAYVPDARAKGLDIVCEAWAAAPIPDARLELFGIEEAEGRRQLRRRRVAVPAGVRWRGRTSAQEFRAALGRAHVMVQGARWEDYGQAPLEALAHGALLATVPSGGAYEALTIVRRLAPELVAPDLRPESLGACLRRAFELDDGRARAVRAAGTGALAPYAPDAVQRTVSERLLPALLA